MTANRILLNNDGSLTLIVRDHHREFGVKFNTLEQMQEYCAKARVLLPQNFRKEYMKKEREVLRSSCCNAEIEEREYCNDDNQDELYYVCSECYKQVDHPNTGLSSV